SASEKHISEGERSMLSAYREAGIRFMKENQGTLIPFYAFYDTIQEFLQPIVYRVIEGAAINPDLSDDSFNNDLLKVLFMVKYVKEMPANIDNIATLMVTHIDEDKLQLKEKIKTSLRKLINQTLIQKNGEEYIFLTDDEQDVNREIKEITVEETAIRRVLSEYIYQDLYSMNKYSYSKMYDFPFNKKMDDTYSGNQSASIGVHIISSLSDHYDKSEQELMMMSTGSGNEVIVRLDDAGSYVEEIEEAIKIEEYRKSRNYHEQPANIQNILNNKRDEANNRRRRGRHLLEEAIKNATFFINGNQVDIKGSSVNEKMNEALKLLVENTYQHLPLMQEFTKQENDLKAFLATDYDNLTLDDAELGKSNAQAKQMIDDFIRMQAELNKQIMIKLLYDRFGEAPYGWRELDIAKIIAELLKDQHIRIRYNAEYLESQTDTNALMTAFTRTNEADKAIIIVRKKVDERLLRTARSITQDLFDKRDIADDEDGLIHDIRQLIEKKEKEIQDYKTNYKGHKYPGMSLLDKGLEYFSAFDKGLDNLAFFTKLEEL